MDARARDVITIGNKLFADKRPIDSLNQEFALNFYPERADFTEKRNVGAEFADHLFSSYPALALREFGNVLSEFIRPEKWVSIHVDDDDLDERDEERAWLEKLTDRFWRIINDPVANFVVAAGKTDRDFACFGNGVLDYWIEYPKGEPPHLGFANHHLRDAAWGENKLGRVDSMHLDWNPTAQQLMAEFPDTVSQEVRKACGGGAGADPYKVFRCRRVVLPSRIYPHRSKVFKKEYPFCSLYVEIESETVLEEVGLNYFPFVVPRWQTVSGSAYGSSMATAVILPDGRTLQVMMRTLREAGEAYVNPPMIAYTDAIRGDVAMYPGGITTSDIEYDGKLADVLRPVTKDRGGFPIGIELAVALKEDIRKAALLDKIQLPETDAKMTATEIRRRIQEHIRASAPIAKPVQHSYNHPLCEGVYNVCLFNGAFDDLRAAMPKSLSERSIKFKFRSPLDELAEQNEADVYIDNRDRIIVPGMQIDPSIGEMVDWEASTRDALLKNGWKAKWLKPKEAVQQFRAQLSEAVDEQNQMQDIAAAGQVAEQGGRGLEALLAAAQQAGMAPNGAPGAPGGQDGMAQFGAPPGGMPLPPEMMAGAPPEMAAGAPPAPPTPLPPPRQPARRAARAPARPPARAGARY